MFLQVLMILQLLLSLSIKLISIQKEYLNRDSYFLYYINKINNKILLFSIIKTLPYKVVK